MFVCGICNESVDHINNFDHYIGMPPVPIYKVILTFARGSNCKYVEEGVCNVCKNDLINYYDAVSMAKKIKHKLLLLLENKNNLEIPSNDESIQDDDKIAASSLANEKEDDYDAISKEHICEKNEIEHSQGLPVPNNQCDKCGEVFADRITCKMHKEQSHVKGFVCEICGKVVKTQRTLKSHLVLHGTEKPFECLICGERFKFELRLKIHMTRHTGERPFKCETCGKSFTHKSVLSNHKVLHKTESFLYECKICQARFPNPSRLKRHEIKHSSDKKNSCKYCSRGFKRRDDVRTHLNQNKKCAAAFQADDDRPYEAPKRRVVPSNVKKVDIVCNICDKKFSKPSRLKTHMYTHAKNKDHKCPYCQYCTANKNSLSLHLKSNLKCSELYKNDIEKN